MLRLLLSILLFLTATHLQGQFRLDVTVQDQPSSFLKKIYKADKTYSDSISVIPDLNDLLRRLHSEAYLSATIDSVVVDSPLIKVWLRTGKQYKWVHLKNGNIGEDVLSQVGFRERFYSKRIFYYKEIVNLQDEIITYMEDHGFPFAVVKLDSFQFEEEKIAARVYLEKNNKINVDTLIISGNARISQEYLQKYLDIRPGDLYNESRVQRINDRLEELPFLEEEEPFSISFTKEEAIFNLYLKDKPASQFDLVIGVLPNSGKDNKLQITGDGRLYLQNALGAAEIFLLEYRKLQSNNIRFNGRFLYPYLPYLPFGSDLSFEYFRKDTSYQDLLYKIGAHIPLKGNSYIQPFFRKKISRIITIDSSSVQQGKKPDQLDMNEFMYGVDLLYENLNYRLNPLKGWRLNFTGAAGNRKLVKNLLITEFNETFYDTLDLNTPKINIEGAVEKFWPLADRMTLLTAVTGGVQKGAGLFQNELYRLGGNKKLRGFDEESVFASWYNILTLEMRYLLDRNSNVYIFGDVAYLENLAENAVFTTNYPFGFGAGISFETQAGIFSVNYALGTGRFTDYQIDFRRAKIHFGYVNYF